MKGFILAAGKGERLQPVTGVWPKPAIPMINIPLIYFSATPLIRIGVSELIVNAHHKPELLAATLSALEPLLPIRISHEKDELLGSGGGIWYAKEWLKRENAFIVANGDEVLLPDDKSWLLEALKLHEKEDALATLVTIDQEGLGTKFGAVWCNDKSEVQGFGKEAPNSKLKPRHFTGFQIISGRIFRYLPVGESNIFYDVLVNAIPKGEKVISHHIKGKWFETGNQSDFLAATSELVNLVGNSGSEHLSDLTSIFWADLDRSTCKISSDVQISAKTLIGNNVNIGNGVTLTGFNVIGHNVSIADGVRLENSVVLPGCQVSSTKAVHDQIIFENI